MLSTRLSTLLSPEREAPLQDAFVLLAEGRIRSVSDTPSGIRISHAALR